MRVFLVFLVLFLFTQGTHAECPTCGIARRERLVRVPPPPSPSEHPAPQEKLYTRTVPRRPVVAEKIASYPVMVYPEKTVWLYLSNTDVNRIVCTEGEITYIFTSSEKGVTTEIKGSEAYIKFKSLLDPETGKIKRVKTPTEFYVRCAAETYSFIAKPRQIPSRTVYLESLKKKVKADEELLRKDSLDAALVEIIRDVFLGRIPPSWEKERGRGVSILKKLNGLSVRITELERYRIPGVPVIVRVFMLSAERRLEVSEKLLLDPSITKNPVAISIMDHEVAPFDSTTAVIVERQK